MIEHCKNCGKVIVYDGRAKSNWNTGWLHPNGYMVCDPGPNGGSDRAEPNPQLQLQDGEEQL